MNTFTLHNGVKLPAIGFGTWDVAEGTQAQQAVELALEHGYRLIDGAAFYKNERSVGKGIAASGVPREQIQVTSKVWRTNLGYDAARASCYKTLDDMRLDYLDLLLIHWPAAAHQCHNWQELNLSTWSAFIDLYQEGVVKAIGVSNFKPHHLANLMTTDIKPMVNQIEFHVGYTQNEVVQYCQEHGIVVQAWSPLGRLRILEQEDLVKMAQKYGKSVAQICLRYCFEHNIISLPKTVSPQRMDENLQIFDFALSKEDIAQLDALASQKIGFSNLDSDSVVW